MASTVFVDGVTVILAAWMNDANSATYTNFGDGSSYTGNLTVGSSKMTVAAASGNTVIAGTVAITGAMTGKDISLTTASGSGILSMASSTAAHGAAKAWVFISTDNGAENDFALYYAGTGAGTKVGVSSTGILTLQAYGTGGVVSVGAADSGGVGYKLLRVPN